MPKEGKSSSFTNVCAWDTSHESLPRFRSLLSLIPSVSSLWGASQFAQVQLTLTHLRCTFCTPCFLPLGLWVSLWVGPPWKPICHSHTGKVDNYAKNICPVVWGQWRAAVFFPPPWVGAETRFRQQCHDLLGLYTQMPVDMATSIT